MNQKTLQRLIDEYVKQNGSEKLSDYISYILEEEKTIQKDINCYNNNLLTEDDRHKKRLKELKDTLYRIQDRCPHYDTSFESDPSGGNDSYYYCNLCRKENI